jgi:flagellar motor switch protein FliN/FliY
VSAKPSNPDSAKTTRRKSTPASTESTGAAKPRTRRTKSVRIDTAQAIPAPHLSINQLLEQAEVSLTPPNTASSLTGDWPIQPMQWEELGSESNQSSETKTTEDLTVRIELGRAWVGRESASDVAPGSVIMLDQMVNDPVDIVIDGRLAARGEAIVLGEKICVRVVELVDENFS